MAKSMLVVYYSWTNGNTETIAERLADACEADIARIETTEPYPEDYDDAVQQGKEEVETGFKPQIEPLEFSPATYDVIAVGTPTWWYTMAPAVATFMEEQNWTDKTIVPFMTNAGWPGTVIDDMETAAAGATHGPELEVKFDSNGGDTLETADGVIDAWIESVKTLLA